MGLEGQNGIILLTQSVGLRRGAERAEVYHLRVPLLHVAGARRRIGETDRASAAMEKHVSSAAIMVRRGV